MVKTGSYLIRWGRSMSSGALVYLSLLQAHILTGITKCEKASLG